LVKSYGTLPLEKRYGKLETINSLRYPSPHKMFWNTYSHW